MGFIDDIMGMVSGVLSGDARTDAKNRARIQICNKDKCLCYATNGDSVECLFDINCPVLDALAIKEFTKKYPIGSCVADMVAKGGGCDRMPPLLSAPVELPEGLQANEGKQIIENIIHLWPESFGSYLPKALRGYLYSILSELESDEDFCYEDSKLLMKSRAQGFSQGWTWATRIIVMALYHNGMIADIQGEQDE